MFDEEKNVRRRRKGQKALLVNHPRLNKAFSSGNPKEQNSDMIGTRNCGVERESSFYVYVFVFGRKHIV